MRDIKLPEVLRMCVELAAAILLPYERLQSPSSRRPPTPTAIRRRQHHMQLGAAQRLAGMANGNPGVVPPWLRPGPPDSVSTGLAQQSLIPIRHPSSPLSEREQAEAGAAELNEPLPCLRARDYKR